MPLTFLSVYSSAMDLLGLRDPPKDSETTENDKKTITVRCLLFFDGTMNNKFNVDVRLAYEKRKGGKYDSKSLSYHKDHTNVSRLYTAAKGIKQPNYTNTINVYVDGVGTIRWCEDNQLGGATGTGVFGAFDTGITEKVELAIKEVVSNLEGLGKPKDVTFERITFDLFGFSRGATSARYCVHKLLKEEDTKVAKQLTDMGYQVNKVDVCFVGLFDTVASQLLKQKVTIAEWEKSSLKLDAISDASKVIHLVAAEEHRRNFCLHNIKSAGDKGKEYHLPGSHADVGGGNVDDSSEAGWILFEGDDWVLATRDRDDLLELGWYQNGQLDLEILGQGDSRSFKLTVKDRVIKNAYCQIPLMIMAKEYGKHGTLDSSLDFNARLIILKAGLKEIGERITANFDEPSFLQIDWPNASRDSSIKALRHQHLHFSARWNLIQDLIFSADFIAADKPCLTLLEKKRRRHIFDG